jgi:hypothetical protein
MRSHPGPNRLRLSVPAWRAALTLTVVAAVGLVGAGCFGDDDDEPAPVATGSIVTVAAASPTVQTTAGSAATTGGGLTPASPSATPAQTAAVSPPAQAGTQVAALLDLAPCGTQATHEVQTYGDGIPALTYKDVPAGTPIVFPFEEGTLRQADARADAIVAVYEVEGVGLFSVHVAGSNSLDRLVTHPVAGTVIGHFGGPLEKESTDVFQGYQLFAVASTDELVVVGGQRYLGVALGLDVEGCVTL